MFSHFADLIYLFGAFVVSVPSDQSLGFVILLSSYASLLTRFFDVGVSLNVLFVLREGILKTWSHVCDKCNQKSCLRKDCEYLARTKSGVPILSAATNNVDDDYDRREKNEREVAHPFDACRHYLGILKRSRL